MADGAESRILHRSGIQLVPERAGGRDRQAGRDGGTRRHLAGRIGRQCGGAADSAVPSGARGIHRQQRGHEVLGLDRDPFERTIEADRYAGLELAESGQRRFVAFDYHAQLSAVLHAVGLGVAKSRTHPDQQHAPIRSQTLDLSRHIYQVVVGPEGVGDLDRAPAVLGRKAERRRCGDGQGTGGRGELPVAQPDGIPSDQETESEEIALRCQDLRRRALLFGPHRRIGEEGRLHHPASPGGEGEPIEARRDDDGVFGDRSARNRRGAPRYGRRRRRGLQRRTGRVPYQHGITQRRGPGDLLRGLEEDGGQNGHRHHEHDGHKDATIHRRGGPKTYGTGSNPPGWKGWQRAIRRAPNHPPRNTPYRPMASSVYCEQLGWNLQRPGNAGEMTR
jgi:hypothetical protein